MEIDEKREEELLREDEPKTVEREEAEAQKPEPLNPEPQLSASQKKNKKMRAKRKAKKAEAEAGRLAAEAGGDGTNAATGTVPTPPDSEAVPDQPPNSKKVRLSRDAPAAEPNPRFRRRSGPNVARSMPRTLYLQAWNQMVIASRAANAAMDILKMYRYDG